MLIFIVKHPRFFVYTLGMAKIREKMFVPTIYEALYLSLLGGGILVMAVIISAAKNYDVQNYNFFSTSGKEFIDNRLSFLDTPHWTTALTFILWAICGILVYLAIWFVTMVIASYKDDGIALHGFLTPRGYDKKAERSTFIARGVIRFLGLLLAVTWLILILRSILPYLTDVFVAGLNPISFRTVPTIIAVSVLLGISLFLLIMFMRLAFLRRRLFSSSVTD